MINRTYQSWLGDLIARRDLMHNVYHTLHLNSDESMNVSIALIGINEHIREIERFLYTTHPNYPDIDHWTDKEDTNVSKR